MAKKNKAYYGQFVETIRKDLNKADAKSTGLHYRIAKETKIDGKTLRQIRDGKGNPTGKTLDKLGTWLNENT